MLENYLVAGFLMIVIWVVLIISLATRNLIKLTTKNCVKGCLYITAVAVLVSVFCFVFQNGFWFYFAIVGGSLLAVKSAIICFDGWYFNRNQFFSFFGLYCFCVWVIFAALT